MKKIILALSVLLMVCVALLGVTACSKKGGGDSTTPSAIYINEDGFWVINGEVTEYRAEGVAGHTPVIEIDENGFWVIDGVNTGVYAGSRDPEPVIPDEPTEHEAPIVYASFNEKDSNGNFYDQVSGKAFATCGVVGTDEGISGNAASFNGEGYLTLDTVLPEGNGSHSIAAWVKVDMSGVSAVTESVIAGWGKFVHLKDTRLGIWHDQFYASSYDVFKMYPLPEGTGEVWQHLGLTYDGRTYCLYLNGVLLGYGQANEGIDVQKSLLFVGGFAGNINKWTGLIDELYVYDRAISSEEMNALKNGEVEFEMKQADNIEPVTTERVPVKYTSETELDPGWNYLTYRSGNSSVQFMLYVPEDLDTTKEYPLLMYLHGDGENGMAPYDVVTGAEVVKRTLVEGKEAFILVPSASSPWLGVPNDSVPDSTRYPYHSYSMADDATPSGQLLAAEALMDELIADREIDNGRVYISGYSRGTMACWYLLNEHPEKYAAAIVCCGAGDPTIAENFKDVPLWIFHGTADPLVSYTDVRAIFDAYVAAGGVDGHFTACEGADHGVGNYVATENGLIDWLFSRYHHVHVAGEWTVTTPAGCTTDGLRTSECTLCGAPMTEKIAMLGHDYVDGVCTRCGNEMDFVTDGQVKEALVQFGTGGASAWVIDGAAGTYTAVSDDAAILMFDNALLSGGVIEWDMLVPSTDYKYGTLCGVLFGSDKQNVISSEYAENYYVFGLHATNVYCGYAKFTNEAPGYFQWQDQDKIVNAAAIGSFCHFRLEWNNVAGTVTLYADDRAVDCTLYKYFNGSYIGLYSECANTVFKNIVIKNKTYAASGQYYYGGGSAADWNIVAKGTEVGGVPSASTVFTTTTDNSALTFEEISFKTGTVEWDMTVPEGAYKYNLITGILWGAIDNNVNTLGSSAWFCTGRSFAATFVNLGKYPNGGLAWDDNQQIADGSLMPAGAKVHYKFTYDGEKLTIQIGETSSVINFNYRIANGDLYMAGLRIGLYSEVLGTVFENVTVNGVVL
ncbi:MAG: hypothetical protein J5762_00005 [Clostridia bacterium]|nr:hypothetical protein [Clostridia bacterium]